MMIAALIKSVLGRLIYVINADTPTPPTPVAAVMKRAG